MPLFRYDNISGLSQVILGAGRFSCTMSQADTFALDGAPGGPNTITSNALVLGHPHTPKHGIAAVPVEILAKIFVYVKDMYLKDMLIGLTPHPLEVMRHCSLWLAVTWVSSHWRRVARECQPFWDFVLVPGRLDLSDQLALAGPHRALSVTIIDSNNPNSHWRKEAVQKALQNVLPRLRHLIFEGPNSWFSDPAANFVNRLSSLESLTLSRASEIESGLPASFVHGTFPRLQSLSLHDYSIQNRCGVLCSNLRTLTLCGSKDGMKSSIRHLSQCLKNLRSLEVLTLDHIYDVEDLNDGNDGNLLIHLPHLQELSIADNALVCTLLLFIITFSQETRPKIKLDAFFDAPADAMTLAEPLDVKYFGESAEGNAGPIETLFVGYHTSRNPDDEDTTTTFHLRAWKSLLPLVSDLGCMRSDSELTKVPPDFDIKLSSRLPFSGSELCVLAPLVSVRSLALSCAGCLSEQLPPFVIDVAVNLCPNIRVLGILDGRLVEHIPRALVERTRGQRVPIFPALTQIILPDLSALTDSPEFDSSHFVATMVATYEKRRAFDLGVGPVILTMCCGGELTSAHHRILKRAMGSVHCSTCGKDFDEDTFNEPLHSKYLV